MISILRSQTYLNISSHPANFRTDSSLRINVYPIFKGTACSHESRYF